MMVVEVVVVNEVVKKWAGVVVVLVMVMKDAVMSGDVVELVVMGGDKR